MPTVHIENREGVALLTLDDPERRNALSAELCAAIVATVVRWKKVVAMRLVLMLRAARPPSAADSGIREPIGLRWLPGMPSQPTPATIVVISRSQFGMVQAFRV